MVGSQDATILSQTPPETEATRAFEQRLYAELDCRLAATPAMLHSINEAGLIVSVSDAWLDKLGYRREQALGRPSTDFLTPASRERAIREILPNFFRTGRIENVHYQMVKSGGEIIDVLMTAVLRDNLFGDGRVSLAVVTDITALLEAKRQLSDNEARYRGLVEEQSELVSLATPEGVLLYVNHAYASFHAAEPQSLVGRSFYDFVPPEERAAVAEHLRRVCESRAAMADENLTLLPNGETRRIAWTNRALSDGQGRVTAIHSVGRDIQARVDAERLVRDSEARYRFLAEHSTDLILLVAGDGRRLYASPASRTLLGYEPEEAIALRLEDSIHPEDAPRVLPVLAARPADTTFVYRMRRKTGDYVWVETTGRTVKLADGEYQRLIIVRDIEQRMQAERRLKESEERYRILAENGTDMVFQLDQNFVRRYVSPACREILGYEPDQMLGVRPADQVHPEDAPRVTLAFETLMRGGPDRLSVVNRIRHSDGRWIWVEAQLRALRDAATQTPIGIIGALRDISARKAIEDELAEANRSLQALAGQDALTGLANRRMFDEALAKEYRRAMRHDCEVALIMIDVDHFKTFNDCYGHPAGDNCLRRIGEAITQSLRRAGDTAARYGGEEFAVVLSATDEVGALAVAMRIQETVLELAIQHKSNPQGVVTISAGVAVARPCLSPKYQDTVLADADRALYSAKNAGRNTIILASAAEAGRGATPTAAA